MCVCCVSVSIRSDNSELEGTCLWMTVRKWFITELNERKKKETWADFKLVIHKFLFVNTLFLNRVDRGTIHLIILMINGNVHATASFFLFKYTADEWACA